LARKIVDTRFITPIGATIPSYMYTAAAARQCRDGRLREATDIADTCFSQPTTT
jgi:hypothetical protein